MSTVVLHHTTLVTEKEHLVYLLLIILYQLIFLNSKPRLELFKLILLNIGSRPELLKLFPQLIFFLLQVFALGFGDLLFLSHPESLGHRHLSFFLCLFQ